MKARAWIVSMIAAGVLAAPVKGGATEHPKWMSTFAYAVARCETGFNPRHKAGSYGGAWGWFVGTWRLDKYSNMPRNPWRATLRQQYRVFLRGRTRGRYWGCIANGGYRMWM